MKKRNSLFGVEEANKTLATRVAMTRCRCCPTLLLLYPSSHQQEGPHMSRVLFKGVFCHSCLFRGQTLGFFCKKRPI